MLDSVTFRHCKSRSTGARWSAFSLSGRRGNDSMRIPVRNTARAVPLPSEYSSAGIEDVRWKRRGYGGGIRSIRIEQVVLGTLERWRKREFGYGFAVIAFLAAFGVRYGLDAWLPAGLPFITFFPAVILTSFFAGTWPAVLVAVLSI